MAHALSLVYIVGGYLGRRFASKSNSGGRQWRPRTAARLTKRRMKRLLIMQPHTSGDRHHHNSGPGRGRRREGRDPADGFVAALLQHAKTWQRPKSRLRKEFLESVRAFMRVVEIMWSCGLVEACTGVGPLKYPCMKAYRQTVVFNVFNVSYRAIRIALKCGLRRVCPLCSSRGSVSTANP